ncbi:MAG: hypothetical protein HY925_11605 [Elusimicrobia bacterium]|nr:hypothetical protein [Elusimicrobiota bacterium]
MSLPAGTFKVAEALRKKRGKSRSRFYAEALAAFVKAEAVHELEERYAEGYRRHPENAKEGAAFEKMAVEVLGKEDW